MFNVLFVFPRIASMLTGVERFNVVTISYSFSICSHHTRYQFTGNAGTHFWHAHTGLQKIDGIYGSLIVRQPPSRDPNSHLYDFDLTTHIILLSDWLHEDAAERYPGRLAVNTGQDPESMLINGRGQFRDPNTGFMTNTPLEIFTMTPGRRYRFRLINAFASVCPAQGKTILYEMNNKIQVFTFIVPTSSHQRKQYGRLSWRNFCF